MIEQPKVENSKKIFWGMDEKTFIVFLHLSQYAGIILTGLGFILPLVMWLTNKDKSVLIDEHGKAVVNWMISLFIYLIISIILIFILVGIITTIALGIVALIYPVIGAIKAGNDSFFNYPVSIKFVN